MISKISTSSKIYDPIYRAKEILDKEYQDALEWETDIRENPNRPKRNECEICNSNKKLELHHVRGKKHGNETITVCHDCHEILTNRQRLWPDLNTENKDAFLELGLIDIYELKYEKTGKEIFKLIVEEKIRGFSYD